MKSKEWEAGEKQFKSDLDNGLIEQGKSTPCPYKGYAGPTDFRVWTPEQTDWVHGYFDASLKHKQINRRKK